MNTETCIDKMDIIYAGAEPEIFQGRGGFVDFGYFDKHFVKTQEKKGSTGNNFEFFLLDILKTTF